MFDVCLLGTGGMVPLPDRWLTSLLVRHNGSMLLVDCGEGTQITLKKCGWGFKAIDALLFTHYHADHIAGLPGFLLTLGNSGREEPFTLIGPSGLKAVAQGLLVIAPQLPFDINLLELPTNRISNFTFKEINVQSIPVEHWVSCFGYSFTVKRKGKFDSNKAAQLGIPVRLWNSLQSGETIQFEDKIFKPEMVLGPPRRGIKVSYCTDTRPVEGLIDFVRESDLFICEGMYGDDNDYEKALQKKHMLFAEAAGLAAKANVKELWLTHFSPALDKPEDYLEAASTIFKNTIVGHDIMVKQIKFNNQNIP